MSKKPFPKFTSEEEEREFWANNDSTDYVDWSKAQNVALPIILHQAVESEFQDSVLGNKFESHPVAISL